MCLYTFKVTTTSPLSKWVKPLFYVLAYSWPNGPIRFIAHPQPVPIDAKPQSSHTNTIQYEQLPVPVISGYSQILISILLTALLVWFWQEVSNLSNRTSVIMQFCPGITYNW